MRLRVVVLVGLLLGLVAIEGRPAPVGAASPPVADYRLLDHGTTVPISNPYDAGRVNVGLGTFIGVNVENDPSSSSDLMFSGDTSPSSFDARVEFATSTTNGLRVMATTTASPNGQSRCDHATLAPGQSCDLLLVVAPTRPGRASATIHLGLNASTPDLTVDVTGVEGYFTTRRGGGTDYYDTTGAPAPAFVDRVDRSGARPVVAVAATADGNGYYEATADGSVLGFGDAAASNFGSAAPYHPAAPVVGMATKVLGGVYAHQDGIAYGDGDSGYWLAAADGGVFAFGDAGFFGSMGGTRLAASVVGVASTPDGGGYWMVAGDGGVFCFGDAPYLQAGRRAGPGVVGISPSNLPVGPTLASP